MKIELLKQNHQKVVNSPNFEAIFSNADTIFKHSIPHLGRTEEIGGKPCSCTHSHELPTAKDIFNSKHPEINIPYFTNYTRNILAQFYPKTCTCGCTDFKTISTRETELICKQCKRHISLTSYTPAHHLKTPLWVLGYVIKEAIDLHPQPLTSAHIKRKLGVGSSTATLLKRRIMLFMSDMIPDIKSLMVEGINKDFPEGYLLPPKDVDVTDEIKGKNVVYSDTLVMFSASQRANGFRSRYKHNGQTSSIYLTDSVAIEKGKYQIGTLVHTLAIKKGPVIFTSVPNQTQKTIEPLLSFLPQSSVHFSDEGFPFFHRIFDNYRAINHSARAKNLKRNVWARNRWSKNGVHSQVAEGQNRILKASLRNHSYISPALSQLYLDNFCGCKGIAIYSLSKLAEVRNKGRIGECGGEMPVRIPLRHRHRVQLPRRKDRTVLS